MKYMILILTTLILIASTASGQTTATLATPEISGHQLTVALAPSENVIYASDVVSLTNPVYGDFSFTLNTNLEISELTAGDNPVEFTREPYGGEGVGETGEWQTVDVVTVNFPTDTSSFFIKYEGIINDPIDPGNALGRVRGDYTSGIISEDGVYLSSETGWYPDSTNSMATYNMVVTVPEAWYPVTQGNLDESMIDDSTQDRVTVWSSDIPSDGCVLVANQYVVTTRMIDGVDCSTYFYQDDPDQAAMFLDKLEEYLPAYVGLFGPYPYSRFDVVENFFSTGYGMPGFTLLGSMVLRMPYAAAEGSLAHELVHNWWGNYVYVDWDSGNWCEGLTYFSTNYYWNILDGRPEDAAAFRYRSMVRFASEVSEDEDYPVRQFRTKMTAVDGDIGYDKSSGIFRMLLQILGEEKFFDTLRLGVERFGGHKTSWDDWEALFEETSGEDLTDFFHSWLDQTGAPVIEMTDMSLQMVDSEARLADLQRRFEQPDVPIIEMGDAFQGGDDLMISFNLRQIGNPFCFNLEFYIKTENTEFSHSVMINSDVTNISIIGPERPLYIQLDPNNYIYRHLSREEIPPSLKTTLESDSLIVVLPSSGTDDTLQVMNMAMGHGGMGGAPTDVTVREHYESLANDVVESGLDVVIKNDDEVTEEDLQNSSILCLGAPRYNSLVSRIQPDLVQPVEFFDDGFRIDGNDYMEDGNSVLVSVRNPYNPDLDITFYMGNSPQAIFKAGYIFFYNWDSWVTYLDGTVADRGDWEISTGPMFYEFDSE